MRRLSKNRSSKTNFGLKAVAPPSVPGAGLLTQNKDGSLDGFDKASIKSSNSGSGDGPIGPYRPQAFREPFPPSFSSSSPCSSPSTASSPSCPGGAGGSLTSMSSSSDSGWASGQSSSAHHYQQQTSAASLRTNSSSSLSSDPSSRSYDYAAQYNGHGYPALVTDPAARGPGGGDNSPQHHHHSALTEEDHVANHNNHHYGGDGHMLSRAQKRLSGISTCSTYSSSTVSSGGTCAHPHDASFSSTRTEPAGPVASNGHQHAHKNLRTFASVSSVEQSTFGGGGLRNDGGQTNTLLRSASLSSGSTFHPPPPTPGHPSSRHSCIIPASSAQLQVCGGGAPPYRTFSRSSVCSSGSASSTPSSASIRSLAAIANLDYVAMINQGINPEEVINCWLTDLRYPEYYSLFVTAGYDLQTVTRMTPEDFTAIGIKKPNHRKRLKSSAEELNIGDGLPTHVPSSVSEFLQILRLTDYEATLFDQKYTTVDDLLTISIEDLEDIGFYKLGHQKRLLLGIKKVKDLKKSRPISTHGQSMYEYCPQSMSVTSQPPGAPTRLSSFQQLPQILEPPPPMSPVGLDSSSDMGSPPPPTPPPPRVSVSPGRPVFSPPLPPYPSAAVNNGADINNAYGSQSPLPPPPPALLSAVPSQSMEADQFHSLPPVLMSTTGGQLHDLSLPQQQYQQQPQHRQLGPNSYHTLRPQRASSEDHRQSVWSRFRSFDDTDAVRMRRRSEQPLPIRGEQTQPLERNPAPSGGGPWGSGAGAAAGGGAGATSSSAGTLPRPKATVKPLPVHVEIETLAEMRKPNFSSEDTVESDVLLPFANERAGTIKYKTNPQVALEMGKEMGEGDQSGEEEEEVQQPTSCSQVNGANHSSESVGRSANQNAGSSTNHKSGIIGSAIGLRELELKKKSLLATPTRAPNRSAADVLHDIGTMLSDLTDELDSMLKTDIKT